MYLLNKGISPEQLVNEYELCEEEANELLSHALSLFEQVVYAAQTNTRRGVWGL
tara:strand:- start:216 stop:377 length:162 start_codon:yes stop_codon:yes gene_type:complete